MDERTHELISPGHERDDTPPAPGDLELVRGFLSLHDHVRDSDESLPPSPGSIAWWLRSQGLVGADEALDDAELRWAGDVLEALRTRVAEHGGERRDPAADRVLDDAVARTGLTPRFGTEPGTAPLVTHGDGARRAVGRILGVAFLATLDGSWDRFRECSSPTCRSVFWDRSKNRSGRWCSMSSCGNRAKVRAYRERHGRERGGQDRGGTG